LYRAFGFEPLEEIQVTLPDGVTLPCVTMRKSIDVVALTAFRSVSRSGKAWERRGSCRNGS
jgi:hypothetical protein